MHSFYNATIDLCFCEICRLRYQIKSVRSSTLPIARFYFERELYKLQKAQGLVLSHLLEIIDGLGIEDEDLWK